MKRLKLLMGLIIILGAGFYVAPRLLSRADSEHFEFKGNVDIRTVNVSFRVSGRLQSLKVDEGSFVKQGDILGYLDDTPYQLQLKAARASLDAQTARLELMRKGTRIEELEQVEERLKTAQAQFINAEINLQRQQKLAYSGAARESNLDDAKASFESAEGALNVAKQALLIAQKPYRDEEIMQTEFQVKQAQAALDQIKLQIADTQLIAPSNGVIMTRVIEPGTMVSAGAPILTISLTEPVWVRAYVNEPNLGLIAIGRTVHVYTDSRVEPYVGTIGFVSPNAEFTPKNIETKELRTTLMYRFRVVVDRPDQKLRQGMPVTIKLLNNKAMD